MCVCKCLRPLCRRRWYCYVLHCTWLVNSAAHLYGDHPYDPTMWPAENPLVSVAAIGEGWHNWHHRYPYDYAASEFGIGKQYNPTKAFIDFFAALGMVTKRKRATGAWAKLKESRERDMAAGKDIKDFRGRGTAQGTERPGWETSELKKYN